MAASERAFVAAPVAAAGGRVIASPFQFYTTGEDRLRVVSVNSLTGVALKIHSRSVDSAGKIQANAEDHVPNTNRTTRSTEHPLGVGALLNLTVFASAGAPTIGQTFVIVQLIRGTGAAAIVLGTLLQGYVTSTQHLAWPGSPIASSIEGPGFLRAFQGTNPAAGAVVSETVPTGARWQLLGLFVSFTTDATVGNREIFVQVSSGGNFVLLIPADVQQAPSTTVTYSFGTGLAAAGFPPSAFAVGPIPTDTPLLAGLVVGTAVTGSAAADDFGTPMLYVREWLEVN